MEKKLLNFLETLKNELDYAYVNIATSSGTPIVTSTHQEHFDPNDQTFSAMVATAFESANIASNTITPKSIKQLEMKTSEASSIFIYPFEEYLISIETGEPSSKVESIVFNLLPKFV